MKLQVTLFHKDNKYKPVSTIVEVESMNYYNSHKAEVQKKAIEEIGRVRYLTPSELIKEGYTKIKVREYDLVEIKKQEELRHKINLIKYIEKKRREKKRKKTLDTMCQM